MAVYMIVGVPLAALLEIRFELDEDDAELVRKFFWRGKEIEPPTVSIAEFLDDKLLRRDLDFAYVGDGREQKDPKSWLRELSNYVVGVYVENDMRCVGGMDEEDRIMEFPIGNVEEAEHEASYALRKMGCNVNPSLFLVSNDNS